MNSSPTQPLLQQAADRAQRYLRDLPERHVAPLPSALEALKGFRRALPDSPTAPEAVLAELDEIGSPATVASGGPRYFGFVVGGSLPVTTAANWLAAAWDQNAAMKVLSPVCLLYTSKMAQKGEPNTEKIN